MVTTNTNLWRLFRQSATMGLVLLLTMIGSSPVAEAGTWIRRDWSKVQRIAPGARTTVRLYKDRAPGGIREAEGQFQSASTEAIVLLLPDGQTLTLRKQSVEKVLVYRPLSKRYPGWITLGVSTGISIPTVAKSGSDVEPWGKLLLNGLFIGAPTAIAFLVAPRWGGVYNVPRKLRDDPAPTSSPSRDKENSSTTTSGAKGASIDPTSTGSGDLFLNGTSDPKLHQLQARPPLLREKLLLDLSVRPVHAHRSVVSEGWRRAASGPARSRAQIRH